MGRGNLAPLPIMLIYGEVNSLLISFARIDTVWSSKAGGFTILSPRLMYTNARKTKSLAPVGCIYGIMNDSHLLTFELYYAKKNAQSVSAAVTSDGCFMPCRSPVLWKAKWPSQLDRLRSVVKVQEKRWVCYRITERYTGVQ